MLNLSLTSKRFKTGKILGADGIVIKVDSEKIQFHIMSYSGNGHNKLKSSPGRTL